MADTAACRRRSRVTAALETHAEEITAAICQFLRQNVEQLAAAQ
jgi:hypothetical protein